MPESPKDDEALDEITVTDQVAQDEDAMPDTAAGSASAPAADDSPPPSGDEKKGSKKKSKPDKQKERIHELEDRVIRQMAEFENFRKRTDKEKSQMFETGARSVIEKILPVVDNLERGLAAIPEADRGSSFAEGLQMIYKQLMTELDKLSVRPIPAVGHEFDPGFHNAVMQVESAEYEAGIIAEEMQRGYTYRDTVVRHSMVAVVG